MMENASKPSAKSCLDQTCRTETGEKLMYHQVTHRKHKASRFYRAIFFTNFRGVLCFFTIYHPEQARNYAIFTLSRMRPLLESHFRIRWSELLDITHSPHVIYMHWL